MQQIEKDIYYVGVNDHKVDLFEGLYNVPNGVSYNAYVIKDEKIAVIDTVECDFGDEWLKNVEEVLGGRTPDFLVVHHMEPDHSANVARFVSKYPTVKVVGNNKTFVMLGEYFGNDYNDNRVVVTDGQKLSLGKHELTFVFAPMVHWPEVMVSFDESTGLLFSADAFGKFGALDVNEDWTDEARRYYIGIVGKYGLQVQGLLKKLSGFGIKTIAPLHGPVLNGDLSKYLNLYNTWSSYVPEEQGILLAYTSVYGHTKVAVKELESQLLKKGVKVECVDLCRDDTAQSIALAFKYSKLVLATTTYNADIFPKMREFIDKLVERNYQNRTVAFIENGTWAPVAAKLMKAKFEKSKNLTFVESAVKIKSCINSESSAQISALADELCK